MKTGIQPYELPLERTSLVMRLFDYILRAWWNPVCESAVYAVLFKSKSVKISSNFTRSNYKKTRKGPKARLVFVCEWPTERLFSLYSLRINS